MKETSDASGVSLTSLAAAAPSAAPVTAMVAKKAQPASTQRTTRNCPAAATPHAQTASAPDNYISIAATALPLVAVSHVASVAAKQEAEPQRLATFSTSKPCASAHSAQTLQTPLPLPQSPQRHSQHCTPYAPPSHATRQGSLALASGFIAATETVCTRVFAPTVSTPKRISSCNNWGRKKFIFSLLFAFFSALFASVAEVNAEGGIEILYETELNTPEWIFGRRDGVNQEGEYIHNGKTSKEDKKRIDVGIGEIVILSIKELKPGFKGEEQDIKWEVLSGDALLTPKNGTDANATKVLIGEDEVELRILVVGNSDTVSVQLTTDPIHPGSNPVQKVGFTAETSMDFNRKRPDGSVRSFHHYNQPPEGESCSGKKRRDHTVSIQNGRCVGAFTSLAVFPCPTNANFGGPVQNGVYVLEVDLNMKNGVEENAGKKVADCFPEDSPWFFNTVHEPTSVYVKIDEDGYFEDELGYWLSISPPTTYDNLSITVNHRMEWKCAWFYEDYETAMAYNAQPESQKIPTITTKAIKTFELQEFTIFSQNEKWDFLLKKFGSSVRRSLRGSTFEAIRIHEWAPWGGANQGSAPPTPGDEFCPPYLYIPTVNND